MFWEIPPRSYRKFTCRLGFFQYRRKSNSRRGKNAELEIRTVEKEIKKCGREG